MKRCQNSALAAFGLLGCWHHGAPPSSVTKVSPRCVNLLELATSVQKRTSSLPRNFDITKAKGPTRKDVTLGPRALSSTKARKESLKLPKVPSVITPRTKEDGSRACAAHPPSPPPFQCSRLGDRMQMAQPLVERSTSSSNPIASLACTSSPWPSGFQHRTNATSKSSSLRASLQ